MDLNLAWVFIAALVGGLFAAVLGYAGSGAEGWNAKKFLTSVVKAFVAAAVFATGYELVGSTIGIKDLLLAFLGGVSVDTVLHRAAKVIQPPPVA